MSPRPGSLFMALRNYLRGCPRSVFISDMKLQVEADNTFFYPDVLVTCAESDRAHSHYKAAPSLVVEMLSPTSSKYDRGAKFAAYRKLPSPREYALVDTKCSGPTMRPLGAVPLRGRTHGGILLAWG